MRNLNTMTIDGVTATAFAVPCPDGFEVRILIVQTSVTPSADSDQLAISYSNGPAVIFTQPSNPVGLGCVGVTAALGGGLTDLLLTQIDPVTGNAVFAVAQTLQQMPLPDVWWPFEIVVTPQMTAGTQTTALLLYEVRPMRSTPARQARKPR